MTNKQKQKRRLSKSLARRSNEVDKAKLEKAWRNIWVKKGILNG